MKLLVTLGIVFCTGGWSGSWVPGADTLPAGTALAKTDKYTTRYDYIDVDAILKSSRLLRSYIHCVLDKGPCTREGLELRKHLPDAIQTECSKCSDRQKQWAGKIMANLLQNHKDYWKELLDKYDPQGTFGKKFGYGDDEEEDDDRRK